MNPFWRLGLCNMVYYLCTQFSSIFINIYIFQQFYSLKVIGTYNAIMYSAWIIAYTVGTKLCGKSTRINVAFAALLGSIAVGVLLAIPQGILWLDLCVGGVTGFASGFFYVAYNVLLYGFSREGERGQSIARLSVLTSIVAITMPAMSGYLVSDVGFDAAFALIIVLYFVMFLLSLGFQHVALSSVRIRDVAKLPIGFGTFAVAQISTGVYSHFLVFAAGVLTYSYGGGIKGAGWLNTLYATLTFLANSLIGYGIRSRLDGKRQLLGWIGAGCATFGTSMLFLHSLHTIVAFNIIVSVANPLFFSLMSGQQFDAVGKLYANHVTGFLVREWLYTFARVGMFAYIGFFGLRAGGAAYTFLVSVLCIAPLCAVWLNRRANRLLSAIALSRVDL